MQQPSKLCSLGVCQQNNLLVVMFLVYFFTLQSHHSKTCGATHRIKNAVGAAMYSCVAVVQFHQEGGNHVYMPSNKAQLPDTCTCCEVYHACFYTVWCAHFHLTHPKGVLMFWQKPNILIVNECCMVSEWPLSVELNLSIFSLSHFIYMLRQ
jgi:hypothetical protein